MKRLLRYTWALTGCVATTLWLTGCGGSSTAGAPTQPDNPGTPNNPPFPSTNRTRLYQHGDEFVYSVSGIAQYLGQRYEVAGSLTVKITSVGAGVLRVHNDRRLTLRRGSQVLNDNHEEVFYISQDRQSREVTLIGYAPDLDSPIINSNLPYRACAPGILNENSTFSFTATFEDGAATTESWQIGVIEPVSTYAGQYHCYRMRIETQWDNPAPFPDTVATATCWLSPQLGVTTRSETLESGWLDSEPIEYRLTLLLRRTNVSLSQASL